MRAVLSANLRPQIEQANGFSPVWTRTCVAKFDLVANLWPQTEQMCAFSPVCKFRCLFREPLVVKHCPHTSHTLRLATLVPGVVSCDSVASSQVLMLPSNTAAPSEVSALFVDVLTDTIVGRSAAASDGPFLSMSTKQDLVASGGGVAGGLLGSTLMSTPIMPGGGVAGGLLGSTLMSTPTVPAGGMVGGLLGSTLMLTLVMPFYFGSSFGSLPCPSILCVQRRRLVITCKLAMSASRLCPLNCDASVPRVYQLVDSTDDSIGAVLTP